ncbi:MAG: ACT domain-containing protein [Ruminococcaceae bacterium]|nr:ACT domain-containing protein [Oscillospiraceae bacterium]
MKAIVSVIGRDRVGIIAEVSALCASLKINVLDISQTVLSDYFTMIMLVDMTLCDIPFSELSALLKEEGERSGLSISIQREEIFNAMHRI